MEGRKRPRLLVTGAGGFIGSAVCKAAVKAGLDVAGIYRPSFRQGGVAGVRRILGTLPYDIPPEALEVDIVIHCAALTKASTAAEARAVNFDGTAFLLMLAKAARRQTRFIFVSSQSAIMANDSDYATTKREAEELVRTSGLPYAIIRPGLVYGPGNVGLYARMRTLALAFPVIPTPGTGEALVQPVHVDDLVKVLLHPDVLGKNENLELNIGSPPITLATLLRDVENQAGKKARPMVKVPLMPLKVAAAFADRTGIKLPISRDNLRGLETVEAMETEPSLNRLHISLRPFAQKEDGQTNDPASEDPRLPVLLMGAGKVGIVHATNLLHRADVRLAAIVDPSRKSWKLYRGIGINVPYFESLQAALQKVEPKAVIIATPADKHLAVAEECLKAGMHVLTEKPSSVRPEQLLEWAILKQSHPDRAVHVGYMAAQMPHVESARSLLVSGAIGRVTGVTVVAVQTHIMSATPVRWEMIKARSGGGVLINFGCHSLSILQRLFGLPESVAGNCWGIHSREVEDAVAARLEFDNFGCDYFTCWSLRDYARPVMWIEIRGQIGTLVIDYFGLSLKRGQDLKWIDGQPDAALPFNFSPDYTGAGFWQEHEGFFSAANERSRDEATRPVDFEEAAALEQWIFDFYKEAATGFPAKDILTDRRISDLVKQAKPTARGGVRRDLA